MKEEIHEMHEHAHAAHSDASLIPVTVTLSILAVLVAIVSLFGHRSHTEELLNQNKATDQWAYYQAKNIRSHSYAQFLDLLAVIPLKDEGVGEKLKQKYEKELDRYKDEQSEIEKEARKLEQESEAERKKANHYDFGEILLEAALVITSITLITKWRSFWYVGLILGASGIVVGTLGFLVT